jgi:hypothetical protein
VTYPITPDPSIHSFPKSIQRPATSPFNSDQLARFATGLLNGIVARVVHIVTFGVVPEGAVTQALTGLENWWQGFLNDAHSAFTWKPGLPTATTSTNTRVSDFADAARGVQKTAVNAQTTAVDNAKQIADIQAQQQAVSNSGNSDKDGFDYTTTTGLNGNWSLSGTGTVQSDGRALVWVSGTGTVRAQFIATPTVTTSQQVSVVIDENVFAAASSSASPTPMLGLVLRLDLTWSSYVYARIVPTSTAGQVQLTLWKVSGGSEAQITVAGAGVYSWILKVGDTIRVTALTSGSTITFRAYVNGSEVTSINDSSTYGGFLSVDTAANTYTGLLLRGGTYFPPGIGAFSISDISAPTVVGSGIKVRRTALTLASISSGENIFPLGWFGDATYTPDITYDTSGSNTGKVTVSVEGWYQCNFCCGTTGNSANNGILYTILWTGSGSGTRQVYSYGSQSRFNFAGGTAPVISGSFLIYLKAGDYVEPGYYSNVSISSAMGSTVTDQTAALSASKTCWWTVALVNRSYS